LCGFGMILHYGIRWHWCKRLLEFNLPRATKEKAGQTCV
jgi:hypothetical protein